jgi:hypothetical protein
MSVKMKKKQKTGAGTSPASHPREQTVSAGRQDSSRNTPEAGLTGIGRSFSGLIDRTRAYFRQAETAES